MHQHRPVGLDHQHPGRHREVGGQPPGVVDLALGYDESHGRRIYSGSRCSAARRSTSYVADVIAVGRCSMERARASPTTFRTPAEGTADRTSSSSSTGSKLGIARRSRSARRDHGLDVTPGGRGDRGLPVRRDARGHVVRRAARGRRHVDVGAARLARRHAPGRVGGRTARRQPRSSSRSGSGAIKLLASELGHCQERSARGSMRGMTTSPAERTFTTVGVIGLGTMGAGIAEVFARNGYAVVGVEKDEEGLARGRQHLEHSTARAVRREKMTEAEQAELLGPDHVHDLAQGPQPTPTSWSRRSWSRWRSRRRCSASSTRSSRRTPCSRPTPRACRSPRSRPRTPSPGRVIGVHFFNPAPVQNLVEIVRTVVTEDQVLADMKALVEAVGKTPSSAATRPASSPTRCCSATSTTRSRCTRAATPAARTSTRRCASAAATRWARWRCST